MMVVDVGTGSGGFQAGEPRELFGTQPDWVFGDITGNRYEVAPDDQRFLMARLVPTSENEGAEPTAVLVNNFAVELKARVGGG